MLYICSLSFDQLENTIHQLLTFLLDESTSGTKQYYLYNSARTKYKKTKTISRRFTSFDRTSYSETRCYSVNRNLDSRPRSCGGLRHKTLPTNHLKSETERQGKVWCGSFYIRNGLVVKIDQIETQSECCSMNVTFTSSV